LHDFVPHPFQRVDLIVGAVGAAAVLEFFPLACEVLIGQHTDAHDFSFSSIR